MLTFNNKIITYNTKWIGDTYTPQPLGPGVIRVRTNDGKVPDRWRDGDTGVYITTYETATLVEGTNDIYDVYKSGTDFTNLLYSSENVVEVIAANTSGITNMSHMFYHCIDLSSVVLFDTSSVTDMSYMFHGCNALTTVPLYDTSNVTDMHYMFYACGSLTTVPLFDISNITDMSGMFSYCSSLTTVPLFDTSNVTNMNQMFHSCGNLTIIPLFDTSKVTDIAYAFYNCRKVESGALALYNQASSQAVPPSSYSHTFYQCGDQTTTGAAELAQIPLSWVGWTA